MYTLNQYDILRVPPSNAYRTFASRVNDFTNPDGTRGDLNSTWKMSQKLIPCDTIVKLMNVYLGGTSKQLKHPLRYLYLNRRVTVEETRALFANVNMFDNSTPQCIIVHAQQGKVPISAFPTILGAQDYQPIPIPQVPDLPGGYIAYKSQRNNDLVLITDTVDIPSTHRVATLALTMYMNLTGIKNRLPQEFKDLLRELLMNPEYSAQDYVEKLDPLIESEDVQNFLKKWVEERVYNILFSDPISEQQNYIEKQKEVLQQKIDEINSINQEIRRAQWELLIREKTKDEANIEFFQYVTTHENITDVDVDSRNNRMILRGMVPLRNYNKEHIEILLRKNNGNVFWNVGGFNVPENIRRIFSLLLEDRYRPMIGYAFTLDFRGNNNGRNITAFDLNNIEQTEQLLYGSIINPHMKYYDCWSNAKAAAGQAINSGHFATAIEILLDAAASINFADNPVMNKMVYEMVQQFEWDPNRLSTKRQLLIYDAEEDHTLHATELLTQMFPDEYKEEEEEDESITD